MAIGEIRPVIDAGLFASETDIIQRQIDGSIMGSMALNSVECMAVDERSPIMSGGFMDFLEPSALEENWQDGANCLGVDPELFFPERGTSTKEAKDVCRGCIVREQCLEFSLQNGEKFGIWGGLSERERRRIRRQRAQVAKSIVGS